MDMDNHFLFTKTKIEALPKAAPGKRGTYYDTKTPKLALRITAAGSRTFCLLKRVGPTTVWYTLGRFPDMTVEQARNEAVKALASFVGKNNPAEVRRALKKEPTFAELFAEYGERHGSKKKSWAADQSNYSNHLQLLASMKISTIDTAAVSRILSAVEKAGRAGGTVNNVRALISSVFSRAIEWGYVTQNPARGTKTRAKVKRDRFLLADELPRFFQALEEEGERWRDLILLSLLTGARRGNLLAMRWNDVRIDEAVWRIPDTKNGTPQNVTLSPVAVEILTERKKAADEKAVFVFPTEKSKSGHTEEPTKVVRRVMDRAGIPYGRKVENGVTLHDLRRTLGSWQAKTGASLAVIGKSLNHQSVQATAIYARLDLDPVRSSVNRATTAMISTATGSEAEVIALKRAAQ